MVADLPEHVVDQEPPNDGADATAPHPKVILQPAWEQLSPGEKAGVLRGLVEQVAYDGANGKVAITFRPHGIVALATREEEP